MEKGKVNQWGMEVSLRTLKAIETFQLFYFVHRTPKRNKL